VAHQSKQSNFPTEFCGLAISKRKSIQRIQDLIYYEKKKKRNKKKETQDGELFRLLLTLREHRPVP
jgi:hypothetical protein